MRFLVVGGVNTALDFVLFAALFYGAGWHVIAANTVSYGLGLASAFFMNKRWTFADGGSLGAHRIWLSLGFGYAGLLLNTLIVWTLAAMMHAMLAKVIAVIAVLFFNYFVNKIIVFRVKN